MRRWTAPETDLLRELAADGTPDAEIADELNTRFGTTRTAAVVCRRRARCGIRTAARAGQPPDTAQRSRILTFLADGRTLSWIARRLGVTQPAVGEVVARLVAEGLVRRTGGATRSVRYVPTLAWIRDRE